MKLINTKDAVGHVLCHDITQIIPGVTKDAVFRKGHIVTEEDIPVLLSVGKESLYVWENDDSMLHENEAAEILCQLCESEHMVRGEVKEGKIELFATCDGLLKINRAGLKVINSFGRMMIASRHGDFPIRKGEKIAGTRIIPLVIEKTAMEKAADACREACGGESIFRILSFSSKKVGIVTVGNEVASGRIQDCFTPVVEGKLAEYDSKMLWHETFEDNDAKVTDCILRMIAEGAEIVCCTGGMSVDPDDRTPLAIRNTGADVVSYGAPVLPGAMFMLSYVTDASTGRVVPVVGLPGCVMYAKRTIFDLVLPRLIAGDPVSAEELALLGEGGLCLNCSECTFPNCGFGKGK